MTTTKLENIKIEIRSLNRRLEAKQNDVVKYRTSILEALSSSVEIGISEAILIENLAEKIKESLHEIQKYKLMVEQLEWAIDDSKDSQASLSKEWICKELKGDNND